MSTKKKWYTIEDLEKKIGPLTFGDVLESFRLCDEMSQKDFAKKMGISPANLCDLEKGRKIPSPKRAKMLAKRLGLPDLMLIQIALQDQLRANNIHCKVSLAA